MPLHPFMTELLQKLAGRPAISAGSAEEGRLLVAAGRAALGRGPELAVVCDIEIPSRDGKMPARYFAPSANPDGLVLYLHGGGWVVGALDDYDCYARTLAAETNYGVLLLDYRLAPEEPFPAGLEDCIDAINACLTGTVPALPITRPLIVAGDSAGANLATVALRRISDRQDVALQVLYYPVTDCNFETASYTAHGEGLPLTRKDMQWFFGHYAPRDLWVSADISPLNAEGLDGMPPAVVVTAEYDVLRDEGEAYARKLEDAGTHVTMRQVEGVAHGFVRLHNLFSVSMDELRAVSADIRRTRGSRQVRGE